ncbi:MAG: T9SS type A sorting domain-containing protein [Candidatus Eisenbacteria bacterium]|uniref:T9SS type A sorting domain-containing protein n=1 Tax=Eiseniibacteriota bacterium TaxID=2212470 RepID=A0A933S9R5_UNCEI|nr:T9SS type A sorting domain-containing protein [Candidatus Eisenbacteria bacterium]
MNRSTVAACVLPLCLCSMLATATVARAADWNVIPSGTTSDLLAVLKSGIDGRIVGRGGYIGLANPTRTAWSPIATPTASDLYSVLSQSVGQVWIGSESGAVHVQLGGTWNSRPIPNSGENFVLVSNSSMAAFAGGSAGSIYYTFDGGSTWYGQASGTTYALHAGTEGFGWAWFVGDHGTIRHTRNGGATWFGQPSGTTANLYGFSRSGSTNLAVGAGGTILRSVDNGDTWTSVPSGTTATLRDVAWSMQDGNTLYAVGDGGTALKSSDQGLSWCVLATGSAAKLNNVLVPANLEVIAIGDHGVILRTTNGGGGCAVTGVEWNGEGAGVACRISGPTPSPVTGRGEFRFAPARSGAAQVELYDTNGRRAAVLFEGFVGAGESRAAFVNARTVAPGVYFVRVRGEGFDVRRKVVVAR